MVKFSKIFFSKSSLFFAFLLIATVISFLISSCATKVIDYSYIAENSNLGRELSWSITLNGSTSMTRLSNSFGEKFMDLHPNVSVDKADTGSGAAITSVLNRISLIGDISRDLHSSELCEKINLVTIAFDGIAIIVNQDNPIESLSDKDIKKIFTGQIDNWLLLNGNNSNITLVGREESSGTRDGFEQAFNLKDTKCPYSIELPEAGDIVAKVSNDKSAIGYISISSISKNTKALKINSISPTTENILNGSYIAKRPFNQIYLKIYENDPRILDWFNFIFSSIGQDIIKREQLVPAKSP